MKKLKNIFCLTFLLFLLTACNIQTVKQHDQLEDQEQSIEKHKVSLENSDEKQEQQEQVQPQEPSQKPQEKQEQKENQPKLEIVKEAATKEIVTEETKQENQKRVAADEKEQVQQNTKKTEESKELKLPVREQPKEKTEKQQPSKEEIKQPKPIQPSASPQIQIPKTQEPVKRYVTITIRVDTLLKNWDLLDPSVQSEQYVPSNGVVLKTTKYELLSEKETVWDILKRATREHEIQLEYQGANETLYNSVYIEGINHLYEFSAGPLSGWMYKVNGVYPNYGCSQYVLQNGDVIEWDYTVDLGRDLGKSVAGES